MSHDTPFPCGPPGAVRHPVPAVAGPRADRRRAHAGRQRRLPRRHPPSPRAAAAVGTAWATTAVPAEFAAYAKASTQKSRVPTEVVDPTVKEYSLTAPVGARVAAGSLAARTDGRPRRQHRDQPAAARDRLRRGRGHLGRRPVGVRRRHRRRGPVAGRRHLVGLDAGRVPRRARAGPRQRGGPQGPPRHRPAAGRRRRRGAGPGRRDQHRPRRPQARGDRPGRGDRHRGGGPRDRHGRHRRAGDGPGGPGRSGSRRRGCPGARAGCRPRPTGEEGIALQRATYTPKPTSTPAPSGVPTSGCATPARCATTRCTPASCTTR